MTQKFINKLISQTQEQKIWWNKYVHPQTYNFNYSITVKDTLIVLTAKRSRDFFTIERLNLFIPKMGPVTSDFEVLYPLFDAVHSQKKPVPEYISKWIEEYIKK